MDKTTKKTLFIVIGYIIVLFILFKFKPIIGVAILLASMLYALYSNLSEVYATLGNKRFAVGDLDGTAQWYEKALKVKNCKAKTKTSYAYLLLKSGKVKESDEILKGLEKFKLSPKDDSQYKMTYALVKWKSGDIDSAISMLEYVHTNYPCTIAYESLGYMYILKGDLQKALEYTLEALDYNSDSNVINDNLGEIYYYLGDFDKAIEVYEKLIAKNPTFPEPYYFYALSLKNKNNKEKALEMLEKALTFKEAFLSILNHDIIVKEIETLK